MLPTEITRRHVIEYMLEHGRGPEEILDFLGQASQAIIGRKSPVAKLRIGVICRTMLREWGKIPG